MHKLFYTFLLSTLLLSVSYGTEDSGMTPRLGIVLPIKQEAKQVVATQAFLWSPAAMVSEGSHIRMILLPDEAEDKGMYRQGRRTELKKAFMRPTHEDQLEFTKSTLKKKMEEQIANNVWENEGHFRAILERKDRDNMYLVYLPPGAADVEIERVDFPEGMFLVQQDDRIVVASVVNGSDADRFEVQAGMFLKEIDGVPLGNDLKKFGALYIEKKIANGENNTPITMVFETDAGVIKKVEFKPLASLQSDFWSQFPEANKNTGGIRKLEGQPKTPAPEPAEGEDKPKDLIFNK
jgi:hypothetical protein